LCCGIADKPKIKAGIDLVPKLKRKEGEGLPGQATTVESDEAARLKRLADAKERDAKRAAEKKRKAEEEAAAAEQKKKNKQRKSKKKTKRTVEDVVTNKEL
jgi:sRNA-binding protein